MDYTQTKAWRDGVERARTQLALQPPDDHTVSVSLERGDPSDPGSVEFIKLCKLCGWPRASKRCPHGPEGVVASGQQDPAVTNDG